jgi:hypothetical protein
MRLDGRIVRYRMSDVVRIEQEGCADRKERVQRKALLPA